LHHKNAFQFGGRYQEEDEGSIKINVIHILYFISPPYFFVCGAVIPLKLIVTDHKALKEVRPFRK
jgi:hypothetical protein